MIEDNEIPKYPAQSEFEFKNPTAISIKDIEPKVTIILTSHERPGFLIEAIDSVFHQTMEDWELIVVDSSRSPEVGRILKKASKDDRVLLLHEPRNVGNLGNISQAWNRALDFVQGQYVAFLDDDNKKEPKFCEKLSKYLDKHPEHDAVCCFSKFIDGKGDNSSQRRFPIGVNKQNILFGNYVDSGELLARRKIFDRVGYFDERLNTEEDWDMIIRILYETKGIGVLQEKLTSYRMHPERRMPKTIKFTDKNRQLVFSKRHGGLIKVACLYPDSNRLTPSQRQVCLGIADAIPKLPFADSYVIGTVLHHDAESVAVSDFLLVLAPFGIKIEEMERLASYKVPIVTVHMEDPQAVRSNAERDKFAKWVVTNDVSTLPYYARVINSRRVLFCPILSISPNVFGTDGRWPKEYDVVICGHAYPSRLQFMKDFLKQPPECKMFFVGDGWSELGSAAVTSPTQDEVTTMEIYRSAKMIVCLHRDGNDLGGFPKMYPQSIQRGYIEAYSGALVLIDNTRSQNSFGRKEVVFFDSPGSLRQEVIRYLDRPHVAEAMASRAKIRAARNFTFESRLAKVINCVRSERYEMVVP